MTLKNNVELSDHPDCLRCGGPLVPVGNLTNEKLWFFHRLSECAVDAIKQRDAAIARAEQAGRSLETLKQAFVDDLRKSSPGKAPNE